METKRDPDVRGMVCYTKYGLAFAMLPCRCMNVKDVTQNVNVGTDVFDSINDALILFIFSVSKQDQLSK